MEEDKLLYPRFPIMHTWFYDDGSREYPLSRVLATWGYVIRYISFEIGKVVVMCYTGDDERKYGRVELKIPLSENAFSTGIRPYDIIVRYELKDKEIVNPECVAIVGYNNPILNQ